MFQKNTLTLSCKSFSFDKFIKENLKEKIPGEIMISNAEKLAHDLRNRNILSFLKIKPQDIYEFKDRQTNDTSFSKIMLESQTVTGIIIYDLLWGASSFRTLFATSYVY